MGTPGQGVHDWGNSLHAILEPRDIENGYLSDDFILAMWREGDNLDGGEGSVGGGGSNLTGDSGSPVYDEHGNFLGTDNGGLQGVIIVMKRDDFVQGMDHDEALSLSTDLDENDKDAEIKLYYHYKDLINRPDWDGFVTIEEGIAWAKSHMGALENPTPDNMLYINTSLLDFGSLSVGNLKNGEGVVSPINLFTASNFMQSLTNVELRATVYALGRVGIILENATLGTIRIDNDCFMKDGRATDYDWNGGGGIIRSNAIRIEKWRASIPDGAGFRVFYYGVGYLNR